MLTTPTSTSSDSHSANSLPGGHWHLLLNLLARAANPNSGGDPNTNLNNTNNINNLTLASNANANNHNIPVCIGHGLDPSSTGLIAALVIPGAVGLVLWIIFAALRPRFRHVYGVREWFAPQLSRPPPLSNKWYAFLFPHNPLVPRLPPKSEHDNPSEELYLSDGELSQRTLYTCFLVVLVWSIVGLGGGLPLYLVGLPCLANSIPSTSLATYGSYSTLQDLSLLRLLQQYDTTHAPSLRTRLIILTALTLALTLLPALLLFLREFHAILHYRRQWLAVRCQGVELGWLSARDAPGLVGWGEPRLKEFVAKAGLSAPAELGEGVRRGLSGASAAGAGTGARRNRPYPVNGEHLLSAEERKLEVEVLSLFSVGDTRLLTSLLDEQDRILSDLEVAETQYIWSFRLSTPEPSLIDLPVPMEDQVNAKPYISRPRALAGSASRRPRQKRAQSTAPPTSYVAPSQYYTLRNVPGFRGERLRNDWSSNTPSLGDTIRSRVIGTRFQEVNRDSTAYGPLPLGSRVAIDHSGDFSAINHRSLSPVPPSPRQSSEQQHGTYDQLQPQYAHQQDATFSPSMYYNGESSRGAYRDDNLYGGRYDTYDANANANSNGMHFPDGSHDANDPETPVTNDTGFHSFPPSEFDMNNMNTNMPMPVPLGSSNPGAGGGGHVQDGSDGEEFAMRRRQRVVQEPSSGDDGVNRDTFAMRSRPREGSDNSPLPPHLRLQPQQPFVRPISDLDHDDLGAVYADIRELRSRLKLIIGEIIDAQNDCFNDIADGARMKGWLMTGRGIRYIPGVQMIEGRSKADIRWHELQSEGGSYSRIQFWITASMIGLFLGAALIAVAALAVTDAPDVANPLSFLRPIVQASLIPSGLATMLVPAILTILFIMIAVTIIRYANEYDGSISHSSAQLNLLKATFRLLTIVVTAWFIAVGACIFSIQVLGHGGASRTITTANGAIYFAAFLVAVVLTMSTVGPALLALQPHRIYSVFNAYRDAITPRQRFRAIYPHAYDPLNTLGFSVLPIAFAATFSIIFPLIGPAVLLSLFSTMIALRFLVGYVYGRTEAPTGGLTQLWLLGRLAAISAFQPILLGLIFLTRRLWIEGGVLLGIGGFALIAVEVYTHLRLKQPSFLLLSEETRDSLETFRRTSKQARAILEGSEQASITTQQRPGTQPRGSLASVLEMMSLRLAVMPASVRNRGSVPLETEALDDRTATEKAARTHPDAPPHLPPLPFVDHAEEMASIMYAPEVLAPPPTIWLPNDPAGIARSEAYDLGHYHGLRTTLDVRTTFEAPPRVRRRLAPPREPRANGNNVVAATNGNEMTQRY